MAAGRNETRKGGARQLPVKSIEDGNENVDPVRTADDFDGLIGGLRELESFTDSDLQTLLDVCMQSARDKVTQLISGGTFNFFLPGRESDHWIILGSDCNSNGISMLRKCCDS